MRTAICEIMKRLCPVLVPKPLMERGVLLVNLMYFDYLLAASVAGIDEDTASKEITRLRNHIEMLYRSKCEICGRKVKDVVEYWDYVITRERGIAIFDKFVPLCDKCLQAVRFNPANKKEVKKAVKLLAKVNKLKKNEVEEILDNLIKQWYLSSQIYEWKVYVDRLEEMGIGKRVADLILNSAASGEISIAKKMLTIFNPSRSLHEYLLYEDIDALCTGRYEASSIGLKASMYGIEPAWNNLNEHIDQLITSKKLCKGGQEAVKLLEGAWIIYVDRRSRARIIREALVLARQGDMWSTRIETPVEPVEPAPIYFYMQSLVDVSMHRRVLEDIERLVISNVRGVVEARFYPMSLENKLARYHIFRYVIHSKL